MPQASVEEGTRSLEGRTNMQATELRELERQAALHDSKAQQAVRLTTHHSLCPTTIMKVMRWLGIHETCPAQTPSHKSFLSSTLLFLFLFLLTSPLLFSACP